MHSHYGQNQQNYSPYLERSMASTTIMSGNLQEKPSGQNAQLPGAPPVNRLVDMLNNKSTYSANLNGSSNPTPNNIKQEYYSTLENKNDLSCNLNF